MSRVVACTIVAHNYLPLARVVARSFLEHHPDARFVVAIIDRPLEARALTGECFEVLPITDIDFGDEGFAHMATIYNVTEFATSIKPFVLRQLNRDADCVMYLDPDIRVYQSLQPLIESTIAAGWSLTPHCLAPIPRDGTGPTEAEIMQAGIYNLGYVGVTPAADGLLTWWCERLRRDAIIDPAHQLFTDQRWIDLAVPIFDPHIERDPGYNVAYWNIDQRDFSYVDGKPMVGSVPVRFFHFSGYDPRAPHWLSKYQIGRVRTLMSQHPGLGEFCQEYGQQLKANGQGALKPGAYGWSEAFPGYVLDGYVRREFRREVLLAESKAQQLPPAPFSPAGAGRFYEWLCQIEPNNDRNLPRYLDYVWKSRHDLQVAFPEVHGGEVDRFVYWARTQGVIECPSLRLFPIANDTVHDPKIGDAASHSSRIIERSNQGVDVVGYFNAELGVGEAGRLAVTALNAAGVATSTLGTRRTTSRQDHAYSTSNVAHYRTGLIAVNADQLANIRHDLRHEFANHNYLIGQWFWEIETFPPSMHSAFALVDEVWAATRHIQNALVAAAPPNVPVNLMHLPLLVPEIEPNCTKQSFGLPDRFAFLFTFDFLSVLERKNPLAVVDAFTRAFADGQGPILVIKTINGQQRLSDLERLRWHCRSRSDITIIDEYFSSKRTAALTDVCDCYVSLHRAEGLGLTLAEAMMLAKPVIATGYSGNMDFMSDETAFLVPYSMRTIGPNAAPYQPDARWAEPDVDAAAQIMRDVYADQDAAQDRGKAAQQDLSVRFSPHAVGIAMRDRLQTIGLQINV